MRQQSQASPDDIDLSSLGATLRRSAVKLIALSLIAGALTFLALSTIAPRYLAQSELEIIGRGGNNPFLSPGAGSAAESVSSRMDEKAVNTHVRAIKSPDLLAQIAKELRLDGRPEFNPVLGPVDTFTGALRSLGLAGTQSGLSEEDRVLNAVTKQLTVYAPEKSRAISINFSSIDPQLAADFANELAKAYRDRLAESTVKETTAVQDKLKPQIEKLQDEVRTADEEVAQFRNKAGLLRGGSQKTPINEQQLGDLSSELTRIKSARDAAETKAKTARDLMRRGTPEVIPEVQRSPLIQNLISQRVSVERELLKRSASLKAGHPVMRQLRADLSAVNRQIASEIANIVSSLDKEAFVAAEQEADVAARLEKIKSTVAVNTTDEVELKRLETIANAKRAELERLQAQFEANRARSENGAVPVEAQILTLARAPSLPYFPKKLPFTLLAMVATLLLGTAFVITLGLARGARSGSRSAQDLSQSERLREEISLVASAPPPPSAGGKKGMRSSQLAAVPETPDGFVRVDDATDLAQHLTSVSRDAEVGFRTLIASEVDPAVSAPEITAAAVALSKAGKQTVVIDWSLRGAGLSRQLKLPNAPGFTELLRGAASFGDVVRWIPDTGVHFIPSGSAFAEGPAGLDADQLNLILDALDEAYDHIFVIAQYEAARTLFEAIQGRFDAGILMSMPGNSRVLADPAGTFLGFEVADIELIHFHMEPLRPGNAA